VAFETVRGNVVTARGGGGGGDGLPHQGMARVSLTTSASLSGIPSCSSSDAPHSTQHWIDIVAPIYGCAASNASTRASKERQIVRCPSLYLLGSSCFQRLDTSSENIYMILQDLATHS
jgi:hypothetical protein